MVNYNCRSTVVRRVSGAGVVNTSLCPTKSLELSHPKALGCQGFAGVVPELDGPFQVAVFLLPGGAPSRHGRRDGAWPGSPGQAAVGRPRGRLGAGSRR